MIYPYNFPVCAIVVKYIYYLTGTCISSLYGKSAWVMKDSDVFVRACVCVIDKSLPLISLIVFVRRDSCMPHSITDHSSLWLRV